MATPRELWANYVPDLMSFLLNDIVNDMILIAFLQQLWSDYNWIPKINFVSKMIKYWLV